MGDERIDQGPRMMAGGGMNDEARRLVDDNQMRILMDHSQAHRFAARRRISRLRQRYSYLGGRFDPEARLHYGPPVHLHAAVNDQALEACTADIIEPPAQQTVEALASIGLMGRNDAT